MPLNVGSSLTFKQLTSIAPTAPAGTKSLYVNSNGFAALINSSGVEQQLLDSSQHVKTNVKAASTGNLTLSGPQTVDGVSLVAGDRVLVKDQTSASQNGVYVVDAGSWIRSADANLAPLISGAMIKVDQGTVNTGTLWRNTFKYTDTVGATAMTWVQVADSSTALTSNLRIGGANLLFNSNFLDTTSMPLNWGSSSQNPDTTVTWRYGKSLKVLSINASNAFGIGALPAIITATGNVNLNNGTIASYGLQTNTAYTFSAWVYNPSTLGVTQVNLVSSGTGLTTNPSASTTLLDQWVRLSFTATTSATSSDTFTLRTGSSANPPVGNGYYIGAWQLEEGSYLTAQKPQSIELLPGSVPYSAFDQTYPFKDLCKVATTANITLSGTQTIDGVAVVAGDRVLVKDQSTASQNGIYVVAAGSWTRAVDANSSVNIATAAVPIDQGTVNAGQVFKTTFKTTDTLGTTSQLWYQIAKQVQVSSTPPSSPQVGDMYWDTTSGVYSSTSAGALAGNNAWSGEQTYSDDGPITLSNGLTAPPATPTTGLTLFNNTRGKPTLAYVNDNGDDFRVQDALYANTWNQVHAINNSTTPTVVGGAVTYLNNATATPTAVAITNTSYYTRRKRFRVASTTTAGTAGEVRANTTDTYMSSTAGEGGFFFVCRFGLNTTATNTSGFIGFTTFTTAYPAESNPGAGLNQIGFYWDTGMTTMRYINSSGSLGTPVDLGANFPTSTGAATNWYEATLYAPAGNASLCRWSMVRLNTGNVASSSSTSSGAGSNYPAANTLLAWHVFYGNGSNAAAHSMDIQNIYFMTDT